MCIYNIIVTNVFCLYFFMFSIYFHGGGDTQEMEPQKHHPVMDDLGGFPATIG